MNTGLLRSSYRQGQASRQVGVGEAEPRRWPIIPSRRRQGGGTHHLRSTRRQQRQGV